MFHPKQENFDILQIQVAIACEKGQLNINACTNNWPHSYGVPFISLFHALLNVFAFSSQSRPKQGFPPQLMK